MKHFRKLTGPYFAWLVLFVLIPLVLIAIYAFTTSGNPVKTLNFTLMNFAKINEPTYIKVFIKSIEMGVLTTGNHSYLDQYASENLCVDEPVI